jgi:polyisoprenoid-binding protein YceI
MGCAVRLTMNRKTWLPFGSVMVLACGALVAAPAPIDGTDQLTLVADASRVTIEVGKTGMLSFAGHAHEILAPGVSGKVTVDEADPSRSSVSLEFRTASLRVNPAGEPPRDVPQVQEVMLGPRVLDAARFPIVSFRSSRVVVVTRAADSSDLRVEGAMTLHGVTRKLTLPLRVTLAPDGTLTARGSLSIRQTDYGIQPVTAAGGSVRVKDELDVRFVLVARR